MSGSLGVIAQVGGAYSAVMGVLNGPPVTIGGIGLTSLEVPATMTFGGTQRIVVHDLVGGGRKVDVLGAFEDDVTWTGYFSGPSAVTRARSVDALRKAGKQIELKWADFKRQCVIKSFTADYGRGGALLPYRISLVVLPNTPSAAKPGLLQSIKTSISNALGLPAIASAIQPALAAVQPALTAVQAALPVAAVLTSGSSAFIALSGAVGNASSVLSGAQAFADSQITALGTAASAAGQVFGGASGLMAASAAQDALTTTTQAAGYVGQANGMLGRA